MLYVMTPKHVYILMLIKTRWPPFTFSGAITETACTFVKKIVGRRPIPTSSWDRDNIPRGSRVHDHMEYYICFETLLGYSSL